MTTKTAIRTHRFTLTIHDVFEITDALQGKLLEAGCDDASLWSEGETVFLEFSREAESLGDALGSAVKDVERAGFSVKRVEVEFGA